KALRLTPRQAVSRACPTVEWISFSYPPDRSHSNSEAGWPLGGNIEGALQSQPGSSDGAFIEQASDQRDAVRHAAGRREFGERVRGVGSPIAARLRNFHEAGRDGERRMSGEVGDGQDF